ARRPEAGALDLADERDELGGAADPVGLRLPGPAARGRVAPQGEEVAHAVVDEGADEPREVRARRPDAGEVGDRRDGGLGDDASHELTRRTAGGPGRAVGHREE